MYKEIQPIWYDSTGHFESQQKKDGRPESDFYKPVEEPMVLKLENISEMQKRFCKDNSAAFYNIVIDGDKEFPVRVSEKEGEEIKKALLRNGNEGNFAKEVHYLTVAIRDLYNLLRARLR